MPKILDLFSGCGGLTLGGHRAGFETAVAVDIDPILSSSIPLNFPGVRLERADARELDRHMLKRWLPNGVDGIVGGPPCQPFSEMGLRKLDDPRRSLVSEFFRIVAAVKPKFFLFENVRGVVFEKNIEVLHAGLDQLKGKWDIVGPVLLDASDFGVPTKRVRVFVFGFDRDRMTVPSAEGLAGRLPAAVTVRDAIADLDGALPCGDDASGFGFWKYRPRGKPSKYASALRSNSGRFTGHMETNHTRATVRRFAQVRPGSVDPVGKYPRLRWDGVSPTLRAGTGSDRGSYQAVRPLHPEQDRVITAREAARLQGFPDDFLFHPTVWHSCRMIGNSVSPILAEVLLGRIRRCLADGRSGALAAAE